MVPGAPCLFNIIRLKQNRHLISHEDISGHLHSNGKNTFANGRPYRVVHGRGTLAGEALLNEDQAVEICHSLLQRQPTRSIGATSIRSSSAVGGTHALPRASSYHYSWQHVIPKTRPIDPESLVPYIVVVTWIHWARDPFS